MTGFLTLIGFLVSWLAAPLFVLRKSVSYAEGLLASGLAVCLSFGSAIAFFILGLALAFACGPSSFDVLHPEYWPLAGLGIGFLWGFLYGVKLVKTGSDSELNLLRLFVYTGLIFVAGFLVFGGVLESMPDD